MTFAELADYGTIIALMIALIPGIVWFLRRQWAASERKAEPLEQSSLRELEERRNAVVEARRYHQTRLSFQVNRAHTWAGLTPAMVILVAVLVVVVLRFLNTASSGWLQIVELLLSFGMIIGLGWLAFYMLKTHDKQMRTARDFDKLEAIERRIAAIRADPLDD